MGARLVSRHSCAARLLLSGAGIALAAAACDGGEPSDPAVVDAGVLLAPSQEDGGIPRRPERRYYMTHTERRCEVYSVEDDVFSAPSPSPCPAYIDVGERIRLAGRSCFREGRPEREQPVVCPGPLILAEVEDRQKAREAAAAAAEAADAGSLEAGASAKGSKAPKRKGAGG